MEENQTFSNGDSTVQSLVPGPKTEEKRKKENARFSDQMIGDKDAKSHVLQQMTFSYVVLVTAICLGATLYYTVTRDPKHIAGVNEYHIILDPQLLFIILFVVSILDVVFLFVFVRKKRTQTQRRPNIYIDMETVGQRLANDTNAEEPVKHYPCISFEGEGFNLYLRLGLLLFTVFGVIYNLIRIISEFTNDYHECGSVIYIFLCVAQATFLCCQTAFILCYHKIIFLTDKPLIRLCLAHLMLVNICIWIHSGIGEISEGVIEVLNEGEKSEERPGSNESVCAEGESLSALARPYLLPALIEYSLMGAPMLYELYHAVGDMKPFIKELPSETSTRYPAFHKAKRGIIFGSIAVALCVVSVVSFYLLHGDSSVVGLSVFHFEDTVLNLLIIVFGVLAFLKFREFKFRPGSKGSVDENILWLSYFGVVFYHVIIMAKSIDTLYDMDDLDTVTRAFTGLEVMISLLTLIGSTFQCIVIVSAMHRIPVHSDHVHKKPGRPYITILLFINFSLWIINTFEVKKTEVAFTTTNHESFDVHQGMDVKTSIALLHIALPLVILFRFHSSICLSSIWKKSYAMD